MNKKIILWLLLIFWCLLIFFFSSQPADSSSALSGRLTEVVTNIIQNIKSMSVPAFKDVSFLSLDFILANLETIIRKCAHFTIFAVLGGISVSLSACYVKKSIFNIVSALAFCVFYASTDEFHQLFVPGRYGSPIDVAIDSLGAICGILLLIKIKKLYNAKSCRKMHSPSKA